MTDLLFLMIFWNTEVSTFYIIFYYIIKVDSLLPFVHSIINHRRLWNIVRNLSPRVANFCSYLISTSSLIYYWTDAQHHGIYFETNGFILTLQMDSGSSPVALTTSWECWMFIQGQKCILKTSARKLGVFNSFKICCCQWQIFRTSTMKIFNSYCLWIKIVQQLY